MHSETMVREARTRTAGLPVECRLGDAYHLEFQADSFDACRADRVFQHLERPQEAFAELVRVARPGARIVVADVDWDTLVVDAEDKALTRRIVALISDNHRNGWIGRQLRAIAWECGLVDVASIGASAIFTDWGQANQLLGLERVTEQAVSGGIVSSAQATAWVHNLQAQAGRGRFFSAFMGFIVSGRKP